METPQSRDLRRNKILGFFWEKFRAASPALSGSQAVRARWNLRCQWVLSRVDPADSSSAAIRDASGCFSPYTVRVTSKARR